MTASEYENFQQGIFDEIEELEHSQKQRILVELVLEAKKLGIDIFAEVKRGKSGKEIMELFWKKKRQSESKAAS